MQEVVAGRGGTSRSLPQFIRGSSGRDTIDVLSSLQEGMDDGHEQGLETRNRAAQPDLWTTTAHCHSIARPATVAWRLLAEAKHRRRLLRLGHTRTGREVAPVRGFCPSQPRSSVRSASNSDPFSSPAPYDAQEPRQDERPDECGHADQKRPGHERDEHARSVTCGRQQVTNVDDRRKREHPERDGD